MLFNDNFFSISQKGAQSMSGSGETTGSEGPCGFTSLLPLGMSCRGRAEAFARRLQSRLRTLGTQVSNSIYLLNFIKIINYCY